MITSLLFINLVSCRVGHAAHLVAEAGLQKALPALFIYSADKIVICSAVRAGTSRRPVDGQGSDTSNPPKVAILTHIQYRTAPHVTTQRKCVE
jgi:hypothetical protein